MRSPPEPTRSRLITIDAVRGLAIAGVVVFHLVWDLDYAGLIPPGWAGHPMWLGFGRALAGTFMLLVGVSLALAHQTRIHWGPLLKRTAVIALAALMISIATFIAFPKSYVFFGILHAIVAASLLGAVVLRFPPLVTLLLGAAIFIAGYSFDAAVFNSRWLAWVGFASQPPFSNDLVPLFPWVGWTLLGIALTKVGLARSLDRRIAEHEPDGAFVKPFAWLGRHSLAIYLLHQPILLAIILPVARNVG